MDLEPDWTVWKSLEHVPRVEVVQTVEADVVDCSQLVAGLQVTSRCRVAYTSTNSRRFRTA